MNCIFCQTETKVERTEYESEHAYDRYPVLVWTLYHCQTCNVNITFYHTIGQITDYVIITDQYRAEFILTDNTFYLIDRSGKQIILTFNYLPNNITPQNINAKIPLWITFS